MNASGAILAGGASSRMGRPKALIPWRGRTLIQEVADRLLKVVPDILVVTGRPDLLPFMDATMVEDLFPGQGPLAGLHAALTHSTSPWLLLVGCDQPFLDPGLLSLILSRAHAGGGDAIVPALGDGKIEPLCAAYSRRILPALTCWLESGGSPRVVSFYSRIRVHYLSPDEWGRFGPADKLFLNINTQADLDRASAALEEDDRAPGG